MGHLPYIIEVVPGFWFLAGGTLAALVGEIAILIVSRARLTNQERAQRQASAGDRQLLASLTVPSLVLETIAALIPFGLAVAFGRAVHGARGQLVSAMANINASERAALAGNAIGGDLNATPLGLLAVSLVAGLACAAVGMAVSARARAGGLRRAAALAADAPDAAAAWSKFPGPSPGPIAAAVAAFLVLGCGPIVRAGYAAVILKIKAFASLAGGDKGAIVSEALDRASSLLDHGLLLGRVGVVAAAAVAAALAWRFSAARARARLLGAMMGPSQGTHRAGIAIASGAIALAVAAFVAVRPSRRENQIPWPPYAGGDRPLSLVTTADLDGPDELERAPVIELTPQSMGLDGVEANAEVLASKLGTLSNLYRNLRPDVPYNGQTLILCQADTPISRLETALHATVQGGAPHPTFGFLRRQVTDRPLFGRRWRNVPSAARTTVVEADLDRPEPGAAIIDVRRFATCAALSAAIIAARRAGHEVALLLPAPPSLR